jgi:hypothetical protein
MSKGDGTPMVGYVSSGSFLNIHAQAVTRNNQNSLFLVSSEFTYPPTDQSNIGIRACNISPDGTPSNIAWVGGIISRMPSIPSGYGDQFLVVCEDTTSYTVDDLFGRFWEDYVLYLPGIKK